MEKKKKDIVANLLDLPELEPETTSVEITRLGIVFELKELPYDLSLIHISEPTRH